MRNTVLAAAIVGASFSVFAGTTSSGGGDAIVCGNHVYLADTFSLTKGMFAQHFANFSHNRQNIRKVLLKLVDIETPGIASLVRASVKAQLQFIYVEGPLPELEDDDIRTLSFRCHKKQLAIQNRNSGVVKIDRYLFDGLSSVEKELLYIHEAYISLLPIGKNTKPIRQIVKQILKNPLYFEQLFTGSKFPRELSFSTALVQVIGYIPLSPEGKSQSIEQFSERLKSYKWKIINDWFETSTGSRPISPATFHGTLFFNQIEKYFDQAKICSLEGKEKKTQDDIVDVLIHTEDNDDLYVAMERFASAHCGNPR